MIFVFGSNEAGKHGAGAALYALRHCGAKAAWGGETVDYEKIAANAVQAMSTADLHPFLVVCALASDLYCPGNDPKQTLGKDSNRKVTAARYKVDLAKVTASVRAELSNKTSSQKPGGAKQSTTAWTIHRRGEAETHEK